MSRRRSSEQLVKNDDQIGESHKSQLKFEYEVHFLNCTIKILKKHKNGNWAFEVFEFFKPKKRRFLKPNSTAVACSVHKAATLHCLAKFLFTQCTSNDRVLIEQLVCNKKIKVKLLSSCVNFWCA